MEERKLLQYQEAEMQKRTTITGNDLSWRLKPVFAGGAAPASTNAICVGGCLGRPPAQWSSSLAVA
jgi:hypothetical protein